MEKRPTTSESPLHVPGEGRYRDHEITIIKALDDHTLELSDGGLTIIDPGDTVTWVVAEDSNVASIEQIRKKFFSQNVFEIKPAPDGGLKRWKATSKTVNPPSREKYNIKYKRKGDNRVYKFDPIIQVNSR